MHYSTVRLMSPPNIHFGSLKDCAATIEVFEVEVISEMQRSRFYFGCLAVAGGKKRTSSLHLLFFTRFVKDGEKNGEMFHVSCLFLPKAKKRGQTKASADILTHQGRMWQG